MQMSLGPALPWHDVERTKRSEFKSVEILDEPVCTKPSGACPGRA